MSSQEKTGALYLVPTPIGNLEDITLRALRILKEVDLIAAEDTRNTQKILNHFDIHTPQISYHEHNEKSRSEELIARLKNGVNIAQVSDAGMPLISDPGQTLAQRAISAGLSVVPLPGANAGLTALVASGISAQPFLFYGFLPPKNKDKKEALGKLANQTATLIFYESPHHLKRFLKELAEFFEESRQVVLARELTKRYEEFVRGDLDEVRAWAEQSTIRGEFVIIVEGNSNPQPIKKPWNDWTIQEHIEYIMEERNVRSKEAIKEVARLRDIQTKKVYAIYHGLD